jgi:phage baseplate assembly protein W
MLILLNTNYGERVMNPLFGANLRSLAFQQGIDLAQAAKDLIINSINKWMPYVKVNNININTNDEDATIPENTLVINISFLINGSLEGAFSTNISL